MTGPVLDGAQPRAGRRQPRPRAGSPVAARLAWVTLAGGLGVQSAFALMPDDIGLTVASVVLFALTAMLHAAGVAGWWRGVSMLVGIAALGLVAEALGVATGFPFGEYAYTGGLGPQVLGVSALVLLAWATLAYPAWVVARTLVRPLGAVVLVGAWALTAWDVFLDTQMVDAGNWGWAHPQPALPLTPDIPLTNYAGWFGVSVLMMLLIEALVGRAARPRVLTGLTGRTGSTGSAGPTGSGQAASTPEPLRTYAVPFVVYVWTWLTCLAGNLTFWDRPNVALAGGLAMGVIAVPLLVVLLRERRRRRLVGIR